MGAVENPTYLGRDASAVRHVANGGHAKRSLREVVARTKEMLVEAIGTRCC